MRMLRVLRAADLGIVLWRAERARDVERLAPCLLQPVQSALGVSGDAIGFCRLIVERITDLRTRQIAALLRAEFLHLLCRSGLQALIGGVERELRHTEHATGFGCYLL